jgi:hypothetical protein
VDSDTPRTDAFYSAGYPTFDASLGFARQLERELNAAKKAEYIADLCARENADWFNALVADLSAILSCEKSASAVIQTAKDLVLFKQNHMLVTALIEAEQD